MLSAAMTINDDRDDLEEQPDPEIVNFMNRVCITWAWWAYTEQNKLGMKGITRIFVVKQPMHKRALDLSEDDIQLVDGKIARLPSREFSILKAEYIEHWSMPQKTRAFHLDVKQYQDRVKQVLVKLYYALMPESEEWRLAIL